MDLTLLTTDQRHRLLHAVADRRDYFAKLRDRSPLYHVDLLQAPLFLLHGENDWRVPVEGSRAFAEKARAAHKPVTYVEVKGQGHHIEGLDRIAEAFQARFDFLMSLYETRGSAGAENRAQR